MGVLRKAVIVGMSFAVSCLVVASPAAGKNNYSNFAKNIIFMVPDGQGLSNVTAARIFKNGPDGDPLYQETLAHIGYQRTHALNSTVTDSAAAASAWAIGQKVINNAVSCQGNDLVTGICEDQVPTILELAAARGKATGLVATSQISHATPAAFGAHVVTRYCGAEIARQYIENAMVDVILGGGLLDTRYSGKGCKAYDSYDEVNFVGGADDMIASTQYIVDLAMTYNYDYVTNETEMNDAVAAGAKKVLGMFQQAGIGQGKTPEIFRVDASFTYPEDEPTLPEMTQAALDILEKDPDGLFLMVEGSQIDWADHANDIGYQISESLAFDEAVKVVLDWVNADAARKNHTLVIVVADHDTAGFAVNGPYGTLSESGDIVEDGWTSGDHTAVDTIIYSQGPGSEKLNAAVDNTYLFHVMESVLH